jgi:hypothetical protein
MAVFLGSGKEAVFTCGRTRTGRPDHCPEKPPDREFYPKSGILKTKLHHF